MLRQRLTEDMKAALRAGEKERLSVIRLMISAVKSPDMEPGTKGEIDDVGIVTVLTRMVKQRRDSIEQYNAGGRPELAAKEAAEIAVIEGYLPRMLGEAATRELVAGLIAETGAAGPKDMGKVMGALKSRHTGEVDMGKASSLVKEMLAR